MAVFGWATPALTADCFGNCFLTSPELSEKPRKPQNPPGATRRRQCMHIINKACRLPPRPLIPEGSSGNVRNRREQPRTCKTAIKLTSHRKTYSQTLRHHNLRTPGSPRARESLIPMIEKRQHLPLCLTPMTENVLRALRSSGARPAVRDRNWQRCATCTTRPCQH